VLQQHKIKMNLAYVFAEGFITNTKINQKKH
jgi:hypothetical protein